MDVEDLDPRRPGKRPLRQCSSAATMGKDYDVFLNHRGRDVKAGFVAHLDEALRAVGLNSFLDKASLRKGDPAFGCIEDALAESKVHVAVISKGYAESKYCLSELVAMMRSGKPVIPVFYDVEPLQVRRVESGPFAEAFEKHEVKRSAEQVEEWRDALGKVAEITGFCFRLSDYKGDEVKLKWEVVDAISGMTPAKEELYVGHHLVGVEEHLRTCINRVQKMSGVTCMLGLVGMGGVGKTTLAKEIYYRFGGTKRFQAMSFLEIEGHSNSNMEVGRSIVSRLQEQLLWDLLQVPPNNHQSYSYWFKRLSRQGPMLIVLDGLYERSQFDEVILDKGLLASGSCIIVASRDRHVLKVIGGESNFHLRVVGLLGCDDAQKLFNFHAFGMEEAPEKFKAIAMDVSKECRGLPLALKVVGSSLFDKRSDEDLKCVWPEAVDTFRDDKRVMSLLRWSYDCLSKEEKALTPEVFTPLRISNGHTSDEGSFSGLSVAPSAKAQPLFMDYPSGSARAIEKLEAHLKLAEYSLEAVQKMSNLQKFNTEQCRYLSDKLEVVMRSASSFLEVLQAKHDEALSPVDSSKPSEIFKLLVALAKQIENFAQGCCKDKWIQAAMSLTIVSDYVSSLGFNLELCKLIFRKDHAITGCLTLFEICNISEAEAEVVEKKALADVNTLVEKVTLELNSLRGSDRDLASYLLQRLLKVEPSTPTDSADGTLLSKLFAWVRQAEQVGRGASATVYKAMWLGTSVAKKTFHGSNNSEFLKEVQILSKLRHPNITSMFCCEKNERNCSIIMELMDGDLDQVMQRRCGTGDSAPFPTLEAVDIMLQIGEGVNYLHTQGIVHRDLKSMNILVKDVKMNDEDIGCMHAKVADFGVSKTSRNSTTYSNLTSNIGTVRWMPPEVMQLTITGNGLILQSNELPKYPFKCDSYSFGMVCYEILTGHVPFSNVDLQNVVRRMVLENCERPHLPRSCPPKLRALIEKCWAQEPQERPTFVEICQELKHLKYLLMTGADSNYIAI